MAERQTCTWTGASGRKYVYDVHPRHPKVTPQAGNFIYAKMDERNRWVPITLVKATWLNEPRLNRAALNALTQRAPPTASACQL